MKKRFLSLLTATCLMLTLAPAAFAAEPEVSDLQQQINAATAGETVELTENVTISEPLTINKQLTLDGNGHILTMTGSGYAIVVSTDSEVTVQELNVEATASGGRGIQMGTANPHFTLKDSTLDVNNRGIGFLDEGTTAGAKVTIDNSTIQNSQKPADKTYENWSYTGDTRGIAIWNNKGLSLNIINDSKILGFGYSINLAGDVTDGIRDAEGTTVTITDSAVWGWTALNVWTCNTNFIVTNSDLRGINVSNGYSDGFAAIVFNDNIYGGNGEVRPEGALPNTLVITGGSIGGYKYGSADENLIRLGNQLATKIQFARYAGISPVTLKSNVQNYTFTITYNENMTNEDINNYLNDLNWVSGSENIAIAYPTANSIMTLTDLLTYQVIK